jgi:methyl-accepting chemotaxis protein
VISFVVAQMIMRPINQAAEAIASSASEIAASAEQQEQTVTWQSVAVNKTSSTIDELGTASKQSAEQAAAAAVGTQQVLTLIEGNQASDRSTPKGSLSLREKVRQITEQILRLSEQTHQIGTISTLVSDLANQINVLALNAAVEAVRAGDHGKGFGVVASEIRKLADESKRSAARINSLVVDIQKATHSTVTVTDEGRKTVEDIIGEINKISLNSQQISLTAKEQAIAIQQVVDAMTTLNRGAAQTASAIRQARVGTQQINAAAQNLKSIV